MASHPLPFFTAPLATALEKIDFQIEREGTIRMVAASATLKNLDTGRLPRHITIQKKPLKGKRIALRRTSHFRNTRLRIARYPETQMDEVAMPILLCVVSGTARIYVGNYVLTCRPGDFVLIPPMVPKGDHLSHAIDSSPKSTCDILYLYPGRLFGVGLECWISRSQGKEVQSNAQLGAALIKNHFLAELFAQLSKEIQESTQSHLTFLLTRSLIHFLLRELREERALLPNVKRLHLPAEQDQNPIKYALTYMESNLSKPLSIADMSRETALSATNFKKLFRQQTGIPFHQYLTAMRLEFAEKLLTETDLRIQQIANHVGLSPSRLNRQFHAKHGCSPGQFRQQNK